MIHCLSYRVDLDVDQNVGALRDQIAQHLAAHEGVTLLEASSAAEQATYTVRAVDITSREIITSVVQAEDPEAAHAAVAGQDVVVTDVTLRA